MEIIFCGIVYVCVLWRFRGDMMRGGGENGLYCTGISPQKDQPRSMVGARGWLGVEEEGGERSSFCRVLLAGGQVVEDSVFGRTGDEREGERRGHASVCLSVCLAYPVTASKRNWCRGVHLFVPWRARSCPVVLVTPTLGVDGRVGEEVFLQVRLLLRWVSCCRFRLRGRGHTPTEKTCGGRNALRGDGF